MIITGLPAAGKFTDRLTGHGCTVVVADVDDVAATVGWPGAGKAADGSPRKS
ncbi:MAG TPA: hypothetical protein VFC19_48000 [Candidatus Limnocylindrales bacterium]|nr:hypothetical protein [Candidatus Limnocylindrales bacterium]